MMAGHVVLIESTLVHIDMRVRMLPRHHGCRRQRMVRGTASGLGYRRQPLQGQRGDH
ncbi:hypothetical protein GCM10027343_09570 [Noviherbaspirillum agri]